MQVCSSLHFVRVYVRRVIHVIVHNGLTDVGSVLVVVHTFYVAICHSHLFVNFCIRRYCIYSLCESSAAYLSLEGDAHIPMAVIVCGR